jgi:hypothetical protein
MVGRPARAGGQMTSFSSKRAILAGAAALLAGGALATAVAAHTSHSASSVVISAGSEYFYGSVSSPNQGCLPHRRVHVFRKRPGDDKLFGVELSLEGTNLGSYTVTRAAVPLRDGRYYSRIKKRDLRPNSARHDHICRGATSDTTTVGP